MAASSITSQRVIPYSLAPQPGDEKSLTQEDLLALAQVSALPVVARPCGEQLPLGIIATLAGASIINVETDQERTPSTPYKPNCLLCRSTIISVAKSPDISIKSNIPEGQEVKTANQIRLEELVHMKYIARLNLLNEHLTTLPARPEPTPQSVLATALPQPQQLHEHEEGIDDPFADEAVEAALLPNLPLEELQQNCCVRTLTCCLTGAIPRDDIPGDDIGPRNRICFVSRQRGIACMCFGSIGFEASLVTLCVVSALHPSLAVIPIATSGGSLCCCVSGALMALTCCRERTNECAACCFGLDL